MKNKKIAIPNFRITKEMKDKVKAWCQYIKEKCITVTAFTNNASFLFGAGILKKPVSHIHKDINDIFVLVVGVNDKGTDVKKLVDLTMTIREAMMFEELFKEIIRRYHLHKQQELMEEISE